MNRKRLPIGTLKLQVKSDKRSVEKVYLEVMAFARRFGIENAVEVSRTVSGVRKKRKPKVGA